MIEPLGRWGTCTGRLRCGGLSLHSELSHRQAHMDDQQESAQAFVVAGVEGRQPESILYAERRRWHSRSRVDVMAPVADPQWLSVDQLREKPELLRQAFES